MSNYFERLFGNKDRNSISFNELVDLANEKWTEALGLDLIGIQIESDILAFITLFPKGKKYNYHEHPDAFETCLVIKGAIKVNGRTIFKIGEKVKFPPNYLHEIEAIEDTEILVIFNKRYVKKQL